MAVIKYCSCTNTYQDQHYGQGKRVHNECPNDKARCTVCGTVKESK